LNRRSFVVVIGTATKFFATTEEMAHIL